MCGYDDADSFGDYGNDWYDDYNEYNDQDATDCSANGGDAARWEENEVFHDTQGEMRDSEDDFGIDDDGCQDEWYTDDE